MSGVFGALGLWAVIYPPVFGVLLLAAWLGERPRQAPAAVRAMWRDPTAPTNRGGACQACHFGAHRRCPASRYRGAEGECTCYDDAWEWHERLAKVA